jgi:hypothetical protein
MKKIRSLRPEEVTVLMADDRKKCVCPSCPTYGDCSRDGKEAVYCLIGKSRKCVMEEVSCICPDCPLTSELDLAFTYYCTLGSELQLRRSK